MPHSTILSKFTSSKFTPPLIMIFSLFLFCAFTDISLQVFTDKEKIIDQNWWKRYVQKNSFNYRDTEHQIDKQPGVFRILILGDSQTVGQGIENLEDTWPKKLETLLNTNLPEKRFEIINSAFQGWNTDTQLYELFENGFLFNPDLVLLGFYLNDTPIPTNFDCSDADKDILKPITQYLPFSKQSQLINFLNFRLNRLKEKFKIKKTYSDCLNKRYESRGWEMEKVFLDTMVKGIRAKGSHLMTAIIPTFYKLGENYPFQNIHSKIGAWFKKNETPTIDLWKESFYGMEASQLIISPKDRHLNKKAAKIIAETLYKKLEPLKKLNHLERYQKALNLEDLISDSSWVKKLDENFANLNRFDQKVTYNTSDNNNKENLSVWKKQNKIYFLHSHFGNNSSNLKQTQQTELNINGNLIKNEFLFYNQNPNTPNLWNSLTIKNNGNSLLKIGVVNQQNQKKENRTLEFVYQTRSNDKRLKLEILKDVYFLDPKSLETAFSEKTNPKLQLSNIETFNTVSKFVGLNPNLFFDFKNKGYTLQKNFNRLTKLERTLIYKEMEWTKYFFTLSELGHSPFLNTLIDDIIVYNPVPVLLKTIERYYFLNQRFKELKKLYQSNPTLPHRFKLPTSQQVV